MILGFTDVFCGRSRKANPCLDAGGARALLPVETGDRVAVAHFSCAGPARPGRERGGYRRRSARAFPRIDRSLDADLSREAVGLGDVQTPAAGAGARADLSRWAMWICAPRIGAEQSTDKTSGDCRRTCQSATVLPCEST